MSDEQQVVSEETSSVADEVITLRQQLADAQKAIEAISAKKEELLKETKAAKDEKRKQAEIAEQAKKEQLTIAEKNGEFEKLYKQAQEEKQSLIDERNKERQDRRNDKLVIEANKIANKLAKGDAYKAELLSNFVANSLGKLADDFGNVDPDVLNSITQQFESDKKYAPLLGGSQAVGGSAPGNTRSAGNEAKQMSMDDFRKLNPQQKLDFSQAVKAGKAQLI